MLVVYVYFIHALLSIHILNVSKIFFNYILHKMFSSDTQIVVT